jgi:hypothetical protein
MDGLSVLTLYGEPRHQAAIAVSGVLPDFVTGYDQHGQDVDFIRVVQRPHISVVMD